MIVKFKSTASGSSNPIPVPGIVSITNGSFKITNNSLDTTTLVAGNGMQEKTEWDFDFKSNPNWSYFSKNNPITSCKLTLTICPKATESRSDIITINYGKLDNFKVSDTHAIPLRENSTIEMDFLTLGYTSDQILHVLENNNGVIPMYYADDAIISFAELEICQDVQAVSKKLCVEAVSEDFVANPGNRRPNHLFVSVTDSDGNPITDLNKKNFQVDPLIMGQGVNLVSITSVQHSSRIDGFYVLLLKPVKKRSWKAGVYIFAVAVHSEGRKGQNLTSVLVD